MKKAFLSLAVLLAANAASAAITTFDIQCSVYTALIPAKDPNKAWNYGIADVFRLKVQDGKASMAYGYGPGTRTVGMPINWQGMFSNVPAQVSSSRWTTNVVIPGPNGKTITVALKQGSRANQNGHFIDGDFDLASGFQLKDGSVITQFNAGFCFDYKGQ